MPGLIAEEVGGAGVRLVRLPRSSVNRNAVTYARLLRRVCRDRTWGGWCFEGLVERPGSVIPAGRIPAGGLLLECAGSQPGGRGHNRAPTLYILWRYEHASGEWRELARSTAMERDWTLDLGPIAHRELHPPKPVLVDLAGIAGRVLDSFERETEPLEFKARVLVIREIQDRLAAGMAR